MNADEIRRRVLELRDSLSASERSRKSDAIWARLSGLPVFQKASQVLFYVSVRSEVETGRMRAETRDLGMAVAAPRILPQNRRLVFYLLDAKERLEPGPFGIPQPPADSDKIVDLENPSVVIVPGLAFDPMGNRLGFGQGYYDRFLNGEGKGLPSVGLAFDLQLVERLDRGPYDVPVDWLVTETRTFHCSTAS